MTEEVKELIDKYFLDKPIKLYINDIGLNSSVFNVESVIIKNSSYLKGYYEVFKDYTYYEKSIKSLVAKRLYLFNSHLNGKYLDISYDENTDKLSCSDSFNGEQIKIIEKEFELLVKEILDNDKIYRLAVIKKFENVQAYEFHKSKDYLTLHIKTLNINYKLHTKNDNRTDN